MVTPHGFKTRLEPQDEYTHEPEPVSNYNESMYLNMFDPAQRMGGWFRLGNRPNEGYAEMTVCLYLPDGRVGFMYAKPKITHNREMKAGGLTIEVVTPFKELTVTYEGKVLLLSTPHDMADPSAAFRKHPSVPAKIRLTYRGVSPMYGGETVNADGTPLKLESEKTFARAHYEQHVSADGTFTVGDETWTVSGFGLRDKSWGPRYWQALYWYRWLPMNFGRDFGMMVSVIADEQGNLRKSGMVFEDGAYHLIEDARVEARYDAQRYQTDLTVWCRTAQKSYDVRGRVVSLIPLRNRRATPGGRDLETRITEGMTEYRCNGMTGFGMSEFLDQIVDGKPVGP
ncbi:MAG: hypothetical protein GC199_01620 [Alphaproteobacteria bacterium]|nr:hypothetical protein [Alphaproteobacteria bacterium]